jgi:hypothetical protein
VTLTHATPNASAQVHSSGVAAAPVVLGFGCIVEVDFGTASPLMPVTENAMGEWAITVMGPASPSVVGLQIALQVALFGTAGPLGLDISNGLIVTVGY